MATSRDEARRRALQQRKAMLEAEVTRLERTIRDTTDQAARARSAVDAAAAAERNALAARTATRQRRRAAERFEAQVRLMSNDLERVRADLSIVERELARG